MRKAEPPLLLVLAIALLSGFARGATIERQPGSPPLILLEGELNAGDEKAFITEMLQVDGDAVVVFDGPGGALYAGIEIGKAIRLKGFATLVLDGFTCTSACALAWLGGAVRIMEAGAKIGFHAAYELDAGTPRERGAPNALVGAYLGGLGLPQKAIDFATASPPEGMSWLTLDVAREVGIEVIKFTPEEQQVQLPSKPPESEVLLMPDRSNLPSPLFSPEPLSVFPGTGFYEPAMEPENDVASVDAADIIPTTPMTSDYGFGPEELAFYEKGCDVPHECVVLVISCTNWSLELITGIQDGLLPV